MVATRIPTSTYRLQFNSTFGFADAEAAVPYLHKLGITDLYASPILRPRRGSSHGYDVTDPTALNPELGDKQAFNALVQRLKGYGMGLLLDIVPNHMAASTENPWWLDVLEKGRASAYAPFFDIDWRRAGGKLLLPILGRPYGECLEDQELALNLEDGEIYLRYYDHRLPLNAEGCASVASHRLDALEAEVGASAPAFLRLSQLIQAIEELPGSDGSRAQSLKQELLDIINSTHQVKEHISRNIAEFNGEKGSPESFDILDNLLSIQHYRLAFWKLASESINYRRFFDISDLVGLRVEDPAVFEAAHALVMRFIEEEKVTGLRLDHIDGLYDPAGYLQRLQSRIEKPSPDGSPGQSFYVLAEKILLGDEALRDDWPVHGTTGYDFLNALNFLFVDGDGLKGLAASYAGIVGRDAPFQDVAYQKKKQVISELFTSERRSLLSRLGRLARHDRHACDISPSQLEEALTEITASMPVYRTYAGERAVLNCAVEEARLRNESLDSRVLSFLQRVLLLDFPTRLDPEQRDEWLEFVMRWQQFTGPVTAKGVEDTALYSYNCLISMNDVGGEPGTGEVGAEPFHRFNQSRQSGWPHTMNATSTHDTKRSEDVRARINVLSEIPREWETRVMRWIRWNQDKKLAVNGTPLPDYNTEWLIYQTMIGAWPLREDEVLQFKERLKAYVVKAAREAKALTSWLAPDEEGESALLSFVDSILEISPQNRFLGDFQTLQKRVAFYGAVNSLSQALMKAVSPGMPDFYQGTELWDFSLVDPDNRRPVDFNQRSQLLDDLIAREKAGTLSLVQELLDNWEDGRIKLFLTHKALSARNLERDTFSLGEYLPLRAAGPTAQQVCAFARRYRGRWIISAVPLHATTLCQAGVFPLGVRAWGDGALTLPGDAPGAWVNVVTNERLDVNSVHWELRLSDIFSQCPAAILVNHD